MKPKNNGKRNRTRGHKGKNIECLICNKSFYIYPSKFNKRKFCSKQCAIVGSIGKVGSQKQREIVSLLNKKHGLSNQRINRIWYNMLSRCNRSSHKSFHRYGGKGINVLWNSFQEFINDMHESYLDHCNEFGEKNTSIDRIDNNGNYCKENCRWVTRKEQSNNMENNVFFNYKNEKISLAELARRLNFKSYIIHKRLKLGWSLNKIINTPLLKKYG